MPTLEAAIDARKALAGARVFNRATRSITRSARTGVAAVGALTAAAIALGTALVVVSARSIARFDDKMSELAAVTKATEAELASLRDRAKELGEATRFTVTQVASGLVALSRAGFDTAEANEAIAASLDLAVAGSIDLARASSITTRVLRGFGREAEDATVIVDVLTTTANSTQTTIDELGDSMKFVAGIARQAGIPVQEMAAAIGVLADAGIPASFGTRAMRSAITSLIAPTPKAKAAIQAMGLAVEDVNPEVVGLTKALQNFRDANITTADASEIFTRGALNSALALANASDKLEDLTTKNFENIGATKEAADTMEDNLGGAARKLSAEIEALFINVGERLTPSLKLLVLATRFAVEEISRFLDSAAGRDTIDLLSKSLDVLSTSIFLVSQSLGIAEQAYVDFNFFLLRTFGGLDNATEAAVRAAIAQKQLGEETRLTTQKIVRSQSELNRLLSQSQFPEDIDPSRQRELVARLKNRLGAIEGIRQNIQKGEITTLEGIRRQASIALGRQINDVKTLAELQQVLIDGEFEIQRAINQVEAARKAGGLAAKEQAQERRLELERIAQAAEEAEEAIRRAERVGGAFGRAIGDAFEAAIFEGGKAREVLSAFADQIIRDLFRILVTERLIRSISGAFAAASVGPGAPPSLGPGAGEGGQKGMVMHRRFQQGGLINQRTTFATSGGGSATTGEGGRPEGVFPLDVDAQGNLALKGTGGGGVVMNIFTQDADSFRRSERQIGEAARRRFGI